MKHIKNGQRTIKIGTHVVTTRNEQKILFPKSKITKGDLINYYRRIAPKMIPYMRDHLISMQRFPNGIGHEGFYQKDAGKYFPSWIKTVRLPKQIGGSVRYVVCDFAATLVYLANQGCITFHLWLSRVDKIKYPDKMIFDLDPAGKASFETVRLVAQELKIILEQLGLHPFVMITGSRGVHIVVPLKRVHTFAYVRECAYEIAKLLIQKYPQHCTLEVRKAKRGNRIFIDTLRNAFGQTGVAPYSVRAKEKAPIAVPISWQELFEEKIMPDHYTITNVFKAFKKRSNPWATFNRSMRSLVRIYAKLKKM